MGTDGSVAYLFNKLGIVQVDLSHDEDQIMEIALDAGADDFTVTEDYFEIISTPANLSCVAEAFKKKNIETLLAENTMRADTLVNLDQEASEKVLKIMNFMDDLDDVQEVHIDFSEGNIVDLAWKAGLKSVRLGMDLVHNTWVMSIYILTLVLSTLWVQDIFDCLMQLKLNQIKERGDTKTLE